MSRTDELDGGDHDQKMRESGHVDQQVGRDFRQVGFGEVTIWKDVDDVGMLRKRNEEGLVGLF